MGVLAGTEFLLNIGIIPEAHHNTYFQGLSMIQYEL